MKRLNWRNVGANITEARVELQKMEKRIASKDRPSEGELFAAMEHAYHHLNFAWNSRHMPSKEYDRMSDEDFNVCADFPKDMEIFSVPSPKKKKKGV